MIVGHYQGDLSPSPNFTWAELNQNRNSHHACAVHLLIPNVRCRACAVNLMICVSLMPGYMDQPVYGSAMPGYLDPPVNESARAGYLDHPVYGSAKSGYLDHPVYGGAKASFS